MKAKLSIILFLISLALMATNSLIQGFVSLALLAIAVCLMNKKTKEVSTAIERFEAKITKLFKLD